MAPLVVKVPARELRVGDFIEREGEASRVVTTHDGKILARVGKKALLYGPDDPVRVIIED
jgi:hypothetical protein